MDFGDLLDEWERSTSRAYGKKKMARDARASRDEPASRNDDDASPKDSRASRSATSDQARANPIDVWLRRHGTVDKDEAEKAAVVSGAEERRRLRAARAEATIDLHGCNRDEAWARLEAFFTDALRRGLRKVLIVHGKGAHSEGASVLPSLVRLFIERHPHAGESGHPDGREGGAGSTWVILK